TAGQLATVNGNDTGDGYTSPVITNLVINCPTGASCSATPPPVPTITTPAPPTTQSRSVSFNFNDAPPTAGITFECKITGLGGLAFTACHSGDTFNNLGTGSHTFSVRAVDQTVSTNKSAAASSSAWTVVDANISLSPASGTNEVGTTSHTFTC